MCWKSGDQVRGHVAKGPWRRLDRRQLKRCLQSADVWGRRNNWPEAVSSGISCFPHQGGKLSAKGRPHSRVHNKRWERFTCGPERSDARLWRWVCSLCLRVSMIFRLSNKRVTWWLSSKLKGSGNTVSPGIFFVLLIGNKKFHIQWQCSQTLKHT